MRRPSGSSNVVRGSGIGAGDSGIDRECTALGRCRGVGEVGHVVAVGGVSQVAGVGEVAPQSGGQSSRFGASQRAISASGRPLRRA